MYAKFNAKKRGHCCEIDVVISAELFDTVNNEFLNEVSAIGDAGDEGRAGNCDSTEWEPRTHRANESAAIPMAMSGNCQTHAVTVRLFVSPRYSA
jgi:hypothetical protein